MFDCGHPPYRTEIHPIDAIAITHRADETKLRFSQFGGTVWYQPADVNLPGEACQVQNRLLELADVEIGKPDVKGLGPFNDFVAEIERLGKIATAISFGFDCREYYDTEVIAPNSNTCYYDYKHAMNDKFPGVTTGPDANLPVTLPNVDGFSFTLPNGVVYAPMFSSGAGTSTIYRSTAPRDDLEVCFDLEWSSNHDNIDRNFISDEFCDKNIPEELVLWLTVNGEAKLFSQTEDNCIRVSVTSGETLRIGTHGFECDFSCGERWQDSDFANGADDRIGTINLAFTEQQNFGLLPNGGLARYVVSSQPDLATDRSRRHLADYRMGISVFRIGGP